MVSMAQSWAVVLLFNANSAIFQLYLGENDDEVRFVLDQQAELDLF